MWTAAEVSGAARTRPIAPNRLAAGDRDDEHRERVDAERRAERDRLDHLLERAVGEQHDDRHRDRRGRPLRRRARAAR